MNRRADRTEFKTKAEKCAEEIINWLLSKGIFDDTFVYVNGKRYGTYDGEGKYHYGTDSWDDVYVEDNQNPKNYFEYAGDFLSMSFEGPLYDALNYSWEFEVYEKWAEELANICEKYGKYFELGNAWNLSLYDL
jgi:hypothetical protein